jgi:ATP-dependent RNA helicase DeaD
MSTDSKSNPFKELGLPEPLLKALHSVGYENPSPIQAAGIPPLMAGADLIGQAQTGTGKTAAFALPALSKLDLSKNIPQVLVLAPTRELAIQVAEAFQSYARFLKGFHVLPVYGGQDIRNQLQQLKRGPHVVVGTPGRLLDHLRRKSLNLKNIHTMVLDEADEMLRMGFIDDVEEILSHTSGEQQTALFSATLPEPIRRVAQRFLKNPEHIKIKSKSQTVDSTEQKYWTVHHGQKMDALTHLLEIEETDAVIVFVRTRGATVELAEKISARGYCCAAINGDMSQSQRERTINQLKKGQIDILIATDVAARGLDVERISHVVNYDIPYDSETYIHRIGRTGRAGRKGCAVLFVTPREQHLLRTIERTTNKSITQIKLPSAKDVADKRVQRFKQDIALASEKDQDPFFYKLISEMCTELDKSPEQLASTLAYLLQIQRPLKPAPERKVRQPKTSAERPVRGKKGPRTEGESRGKPRSSAGMSSFRLEVGRNHQATPSDIVGAIANEANMSSRNIGQIKINDDYSTVELPEGMPKEVFKLLQTVRVRNQMLKISKINSNTGSTAPRANPKSKPKSKPNLKRRPVKTFAKKSNADKDAQ